MKIFKSVLFGVFCVVSSVEAMAEESYPPVEIVLSGDVLHLKNLVNDDFSKYCKSPLVEENGSFLLVVDGRRLDVGGSEIAIAYTLIQTAGKSPLRSFLSNRLNFQEAKYRKFLNKMKVFVGSKLIVLTEGGDERVARQICEDYKVMFENNFGEILSGD